MDKKTSQAIAAVICRSIDYFHARGAAEAAGNTPEQIARLTESEGYVAEALEAIPDFQETKLAD